MYNNENQESTKFGNQQLNQGTFDPPPAAPPTSPYQYYGNNYNYDQNYVPYYNYNYNYYAPPPPPPPPPPKPKYKLPECDISSLPPDTLSNRKILRKFHPERKEIRRSALFCGLSVLAIELIPLIIVYGSVITSGTPLNYLFMPFYMASELINKYCGSFVAAYINQILYSTVLFTIPFMVLIWCFKMKVRDTANFSAPKKGLKFPFLLIGISFCAFSNIASSYVTMFLEKIGFATAYGASSEPPDSIFIFILALISTALVPGMVEEFAFRGILYGALKKYGEGFAILSTAVIFGVLHGNISQIPFAFLVGLVLGYIRAKTGSVWICVIVHAINNSISVLYQYPLSRLSEDVQNISYNIYLCVALLLGILGILLLSKKEKAKEVYTLSGKEKTCDGRVINALFYSHPAILAFFIRIGVNLLQGFDISWIKSLW